MRGAVAIPIVMGGVTTVFIPVPVPLLLLALGWVLMVAVSCWRDGR